MVRTALTATGGVTDNAALVYNLFGPQTPSYAISGSGNLTDLGPGTLTLSHSNSYKGGTTLSAGRAVSNAAALGAGPLTLGGGELSSTGATAYSLPNALLLSGSAAVPGDLANVGPLSFTASTGTLAANSQLTINSPVTINGTLGSSAFGLTTDRPVDAHALRDKHLRRRHDDKRRHAGLRREQSPAHGGHDQRQRRHLEPIQLQRQRRDGHAD